MGKCIDCNPAYLETPDDAVYYTGPDFPALGIRTNISLKTLNTILITAIHATTNTPSGGSSVLAEDIIVGKPPTFIMGDFSICWDKLGGKKGYYSVLNNGVDSYTFSYDFGEGISGLPATLSVKNIEVQVMYLANGVQKLYTKSSKAANAFGIPKANYPLNVSTKVSLESQECGDVSLQKTLTVGALTMDNKQFLFDVVGKDGSLSGTGTYSQEDMNALILAKLSGISNYVYDLVAGGYTNEVNTLKARVEELIKTVETEKTYKIGTGITSQVLTELEVFNEINSQLGALSSKIAAIEKSRADAALLP